MKFRTRLQQPDEEFGLGLIHLTLPVYLKDMAAVAVQSHDDIYLRFETLRNTFREGRTKSFAWRESQLMAIKAMLDAEEEQLLEALQKDLGKPREEGWITETAFVRGEVIYALENLERWMKPRKVNTPLVVQPGRSEIIAEPKGVTLIMAPWNYPVQLTLAPLIAAIAAGNCAIVKPSELAPATSALLTKLIDTYLEPQAIASIEGGIEASTSLLSHRFDHIFFTGSTQVGKVVMKAAAEHLTPVTLELGGKSPAIVDASADLTVTARRLAWGRFLNAGQSCVAPDYVLVDATRREELLTKLQEAITKFFGDDPKQSKSFGRIVNQRHFERIIKLLDGADIVAGGEHDREQRYIAPTLLRADQDDAAMKDEIFGPVLPVLTYDRLEEAIDYVNAHEKPLALYVFTGQEKVANQVLQETSSGGACINDCMVQLSPPELPFGGIGASGMGTYHGEYGFEAFSHLKSVVRKGTWVDPPLRYPPYNKGQMQWLKRIY